MGKLICLLGKSGSGKSTIESFLETHGGYNRAISTTTRPMREGEVDGVNYHYVSVPEFEYRILMGELAECTSYNGWYYGLTHEAINLAKGDYIAVVEKHGYKQLIDNVGRENIVSFLINVDDKERLIRALNREEKPNCFEICRRFVNDTKDFEGLDKEVDYVIENVDFMETIDKVIHILKGELDG